jgi:hypothetical protein
MVLGVTAAAVLLLAAPHAPAGPIIFTAGDPGAGPADPRPNANAAAASFDTAAGALGPIHLLNFESSPVGSFSTLTPAPGVTLTTASGSARIANSASTVGGYNTTSGGSRFVRFDMAAGSTSVTFTFATPVDAFGGYFTGVGDIVPTGTHVTFNDGSSQNFTVPGNMMGGAFFWGFTDPGKSISSITVSATSPDVIGLDDVRFVPFVAPAAVPEPSTLALLSLGGLGLAGWRRWKGRRAQTNPAA